MQTLTPRLTEAQLALLPTEEDIAFYEEHGWYISQKVIPDEVIDAAIQGSEKYYRGDRDYRLAVESGFSDWKPEDGDNIVRNNEFVSLQNQQLRLLALQPIIGAIAARLARTTQIRLLDDQLVYKPPSKKRQSAVGWHADGAYWATCSSPNLLTAWIPFHDCDETRGPLVVIDGSHKWSGLQDIRYFNQQNLTETEQKFYAPGRKITKVPMTLQKGQVSFHHRWTIHGSYSNYSTSPRLALAVHLQDAANHYRPFRNHQGKEIHIFDEVLCRKLANGDPDFSDPKVFPVLWTEASS
ncbi:phytanoyl-CoA dioxygenase family protein [Gloeocapsopsis crepidinum LEGE 06123]|uniref:Phytanoyl-CoA dioxygenase family protein n=1 Tax=Gloeocapsopsis crepidinum LEGE 06123 TaxID=588587 RepID=A0ABR9USH7_9CHRO|nr:phytanoyl-CoA dioxygenase family protein [Gloeocapsopsis crepidinum]MBE9191247.1 phytanoyl-CoA dioxygenase family protein [Gloeocapsopsis crepidinum LEGE 06123]